jgi:hypothetical protein
MEMVVVRSTTGSRIPIPVLEIPAIKINVISISKVVGKTNK